MLVGGLVGDLLCGKTGVCALLFSLSFLSTSPVPTSTYSNFMRKSRADKEFWVIDFGISKQLLTSSGEVGAACLRALTSRPPFPSPALHVRMHASVHARWAYDGFIKPQNRPAIIHHLSARPTPRR